MSYEQQLEEHLNQQHEEAEEQRGRGRSRSVSGGSKRRFFHRSARSRSNTTQNAAVLPALIVLKAELFTPHEKEKAAKAKDEAPPAHTPDDNTHPVIPEITVSVYS